MRKLIVAAMVAAATGGLLTAGPAQADTVCVPITVDGQPIYCLDTNPIESAVQTAEYAVQTMSDALEHCEGVDPSGNGVTIRFSVAATREPEGFECNGIAVSVLAPVGSVT